jgi:two-component SAPR family response regulator
VDSAWADERRRELARVINDARRDAAKLAFAEGDYQRADELARRVLDAEPYRESTWRLRMRIADSLGDGDGVVATFEACRGALARLDASPSPTTRELLERLQR